MKLTHRGNIDISSHLIEGEIEPSYTSIIIMEFSTGSMDLFFPIRVSPKQLHKIMQRFKKNKNITYNELIQLIKVRAIAGSSSCLDESIESVEMWLGIKFDHKSILNDYCL